VDKDRYIDLSKHLEIIKDNNNTEDLHFWLNPENGLKIVHLVAQKLAKIDKKNKSIYLNNANRISDSINEEVNSIRNSLKQDSFVNGDYLVLHDAYRYFEKFFNIKRPYGYFYDNNHNMICFNKTEDYRKKMKNNDIKCLIVNQRENNISRNFKNCVKIVYINPLGREIGVNLDNGYTRLLHSVYLGYKECLMK
jgi:zinc transport system substrate-binding protein